MLRRPDVELGVEDGAGINSTVDEEINAGRGIKSRRGRNVFYIIIVFTLMLLLSLLVLPRPQEIKEQMISTSNAELVRFHVDGWKNDEGNGLNTEHGKELQVSVSFNVWFDYTDLQDNKLQFINEKLVRSVCFRIDNVSTYNALDSLGSVRVAEPVCLNIQGGVVNKVNATVFVKPRMRKIVGVLKKVWRHEYDQLDLWSQVDIRVLKGFLPVFRMRALKVDWDEFIDWDKVGKEVDEFSHVLTNPNIKIDQINVKEQLSGLYVLIKPDLEKFMGNVGKLLRHRLNIQESVNIPPLQYSVRVPNCFDEYDIDLSNANLSTEEFQLNSEQTYENLQLHCGLVAPLPEDLVNHECWSTNNNTITPLTKMLNKLLDYKEKIGFMVRAKVIPAAGAQEDGKYLLPIELIDEALDTIGYIPVSAHSTLNSSTDLLEECAIEGMKLKWEDSRLKLVGKLHGEMNFSFYDQLSTAGIERERNDSLSVSDIKGKIKLYHDEVHFANVPMETWVPVESKIENHTLHVTMSLDTDHVEVVNKWELTKVLNQIMFQTETPVSYKNLLDVHVRSILGDFEVLGLEWSGTTTVT